MTELRILDEGAVSEIKARANAATPGPWNQSALAGMYIVADGADYATVASIGEYNADGSIHLAFDKAVENLEFIKHAREDIPALCATVKHLRAENERATAAMRDKCVVHLQASADALDVRQETECPSGTAFNSEAALRRRIAAELSSLTLDQVKPGEK